MSQSVGTGQGTAQDEDAIRKAIADYDETWNRHDMKAHAQLFTEGADFVSVVGAYLQGRGEIEAQHAEMHAGDYKDSQMTTMSLAVRFLTPDVAVVHRGAEAIFNRGQVKRRWFMTLVMTRQDGRWLIAAAQNTQRSGMAPKGR
jgi:uncharacterized protein (TIGR02246 family)